MTPQDAAAEAEALTAESRGLTPGDRRRVARLASSLMGAYEAGRLAEREACAVAVEPIDTIAAERIRARGQVKP